PQFLALFLLKIKQGIEGEWQYNADLFAKTTIRSLSVHFQNLLHSVTEDPDARLSNLKMLSEREIETMNREKRRRKISKLAKFKALKS
ncbi:MAG: condensation domain-containing protein, partial [Cyanobacteria bacterium J06642_3]